MNPRIASIENLIASDPAGRNIFGLMMTDQLRLAAQSLRWARRVVIISGFYIPEAKASETDGPPGAKVLGDALIKVGIEVEYVTDSWNEPIFRAMGVTPVTLSTTNGASDFLDRSHPSHVVAIERVGRGVDGRYRNMRGLDISSTTATLDEIVLEAQRRGLTTIGIGDGGNEIGMGRVFAEALTAIAHGAKIASTITTDFCVVAGVSNWGAYGLAGALSILESRDLLPTSEEMIRDLDRAVVLGGAVDGITHRAETTVDSLDLAVSVRILESIRAHIVPSPLQRGEPLDVGVMGYGITGRAATKLLATNGHHVRISDIGPVTLEADTVVAGVETGKHSIEFLGDCDLVVTSPGIRRDLPVLDALHKRGVPVMSELEMAYQLTDRPIIAVTGTIGKRSTVEFIQRLLVACGQKTSIGGNRGRPLSSLLLDDPVKDAADVASAPTIAVAVSSFQLETVIHFRPHIAIFLNIDEAHLDRHRTIAEYVRIKSRIFMNHKPDDALILTFDDSRVRALARKHCGRTFFVSAHQPVDRGAWIRNGCVYANIDGDLEEIGLIEYPFPTNLLSGVVTGRLCGIPSSLIAAALTGLAARQPEAATVRVTL